MSHFFLRLPWEGASGRGSMHKSTKINAHNKCACKEECNDDRKHARSTKSVDLDLTTKTDRDNPPVCLEK